MANCARVTSRDHYSTNGVVHIVDRVILPATQTIAEIVQNDVQLRSLRKALEKTNMLEKLSQPNGQFTLFAPTDDAFSKMDATLKVQSKGSRNITSTKIYPYKKQIAQYKYSFMFLGKTYWCQRRSRMCK